MEQTKIKISQKEFDDIYDIEEITEEKESVNSTAKDTQTSDTTPGFLSEEEQIIDDKFFEDTPMEDEQL